MPSGETRAEPSGKSSGTMDIAPRPILPSVSHPLEEESSRRSRTRDEILLGLARARITYLAHLAELTGISASQLRLALHGNDRHFRKDLSPIALGQVRLAGKPRALTYEITPRGLQRARQIAAIRRRAAQRLLEGQGAPRGEPLGGHKRG